MQKLLATALAIAFLSHGGAHAQSYPSRPITLVVPFTSGGAADFIGGAIVDAMRARLGQPVILENTAGDGGLQGINRVVRAAPDGYTLLLGTSALSVSTSEINPWPLDLMTRNLTPIGLIGEYPYLILGRRNLPADNLGELVEWLRAHGASASSGTIAGASGQVATILFREAIGANFKIAFNSREKASVDDLAAGRIDVMLTVSLMSLPRVRNGSIRAYAVAAKNRLGSAPDIPTVDEAKLAGFYFSTWYGVWAPRHTPDPIVARVNEALIDALNDPVTKRKFSLIQLETFPREQLTPGALDERQKADYDKWWPIVRGLKSQKT